jgi:hypothetical protein
MRLTDAGQVNNLAMLLIFTLGVVLGVAGCRSGILVS